MGSQLPGSQSTTLTPSSGQVQAMLRVSVCGCWPQRREIIAGAMEVWELTARLHTKIAQHQEHRGKICGLFLQHPTAGKSPALPQPRISQSRSKSARKPAPFRNGPCCQGHCLDLSFFTHRPTALLLKVCSLSQQCLPLHQLDPQPDYLQQRLWVCRGALGWIGYTGGPEAGPYLRTEELHKGLNHPHALIHSRTPQGLSFPYRAVIHKEISCV